MGADHIRKGAMIAGVFLVVRLILAVLGMAVTGEPTQAGTEAQRLLRQAEAYLIQGKIDQALDDYAKVIEINPSDEMTAIAYTGRGIGFYIRN